MNETGGIAAIDLRRSADDVPAAGFLVRFRFEKDSAATSWPIEAKPSAQTLLVDAPPHVGPRSVLFEERGPDPTLEAAKDYGMQLVRMGVLGADCYAAGDELAIEHIIGLVADGFRISSVVRERLLRALQVQRALAVQRWNIG